MLTKIKEVQQPHGMARTLYRLPIWLCRLHLGWLLMGHFLHTLSPSFSGLLHRRDGRDLRALARLGIVVGFEPTPSIPPR